METIKIDKIDDIQSFIDNLDVNVKYEFPTNFKYKWLKIEKGIDTFTKELYYSWTMELNYYVAGRSGYIFPLKNGGNMVSQFKTEKAAKKNLIKNYGKWFETLLNK